MVGEMPPKTRGWKKGASGVQPVGCAPPPAPPCPGGTWRAALQVPRKVSMAGGGRIRLDLRLSCAQGGRRSLCIPGQPWRGGGRGGAAVALMEGERDGQWDPAAPRSQSPPALQTRVKAARHV